MDIVSSERAIDHVLITLSACQMLRDTAVAILPI